MNKINKEILKLGFYFAIFGMTIPWDFKTSLGLSLLGYTLSCILLLICLDFIVTFMANCNRSDNLTDLLDRLVTLKEKEVERKQETTK